MSQQSSQTDQIAALSAQLEAIQTQLAAAQTASAATEAKPPRALPTEGEIVSYTDTASTGLTHTRRGLVITVDAEARKTLINWLPDAEAELSVDDLDA